MDHSDSAALGGTAISFTSVSALGVRINPIAIVKYMLLSTIPYHPWYQVSGHDTDGYRRIPTDTDTKKCSRRTLEHIGHHRTRRRPKATKLLVKICENILEPVMQQKNTFTQCSNYCCADAWSGQRLAGISQY